MLAAAAILGGVLIAVPFIVSAQGDDKPSDSARTQDAATVLEATRSPQAQGDYTTQSPSPSPKPSKTEEKQEPATVSKPTTPATKKPQQPAKKTQAAKKKVDPL
ncbi:hypothetical protein NKH18_45080 [Streptomyces sp. M10(2022)]